MHYNNVCNTISFNEGNCESKPLNSFVDYDETVKKYQHVQPEVAELIESGRLV